jgi:peptidoglycan/xylan/chitin deacetylase (PgdA/CDA1 family)
MAASRRTLRQSRTKTTIAKIVTLAIIIIAIAVAVVFVSIYPQRQTVRAAENLQEELTAVSTTGSQKVQDLQNEELEAVKQRLRAGDTTGLKVVFLTFDDGPGEHTGEVLDILKTYGIKATFFTNGHEGDVATAAYKRIVAEGHTLGNHTYSHNYKLYNSPAQFYADVQKLDDYQKQVTGLTQTSGIFRFPGGSLTANKTCCKGILDRGYNYADWNVSSGDGASVSPTPDQIVSKIVGGCNQHEVSVALCHAENNANTRTALPVFISQLLSQGYTFLPMEKDYTYPRQLQP